MRGPLGLRQTRRCSARAMDGSNRRRERRLRLGRPGARPDRPSRRSLARSFGARAIGCLISANRDALSRAPRRTGAVAHAWGLKTLSWSARVSCGCFVFVDQTAENFVFVDVGRARANGHGRAFLWRLEREGAVWPVSVVTGDDARTELAETLKPSRAAHQRSVGSPKLGSRARAGRREPRLREGQLDGRSGDAGIPNGAPPAAGANAAASADSPRKPTRPDAAVPDSAPAKNTRSASCSCGRCACRRRIESLWPQHATSNRREGDATRPLPLRLPRRCGRVFGTPRGVDNEVAVPRREVVGDDCELEPAERVALQGLGDRIMPPSR
jgi:hypothetical protein